MLSKMRQGLSLITLLVIVCILPLSSPPSAIAATTPIQTNTCPTDPNSSDAVIPPAEQGVYQSSRYNPSALLGVNILGGGLPDPYYELGLPSDGAHAHNPLGIMLLIHGGGWTRIGPGMVGSYRSEADFWRSNGWETLNIDYRGCANSIPDVYAFYTRLRERVGTGETVCAVGDSAGGHLSLMLAALAVTKPRRPSPLSCVISKAGVIDINGLASELAYPSGISGVTAQDVYQGAEVAFNSHDPSTLALNSPIYYAKYLNTPMLLATATNDVVIPQAQATDLQKAVASYHPGLYADVDQLPCPSLGLVVYCDDTAFNPSKIPIPDVIQFVHGTTTSNAISNFQQRELILARLALGHHGLIR